MKNALTRGLTALTLSTALVGLNTSCTKDLDQTPKYELTPDKVYTGIAGYKQVLAKLYGGFALTGPSGPGSGDIGGIDAGTSDYLRQYWSAQELTTDEAVVAWNDPGVQEWHRLNWDASHPLTRGLYSRLYYQIAICNEFIRESTDDKLSSRLGGEVAQGKLFRAEARFLRAVAYSHVIDLFGNGPFVTDRDAVGAGLPAYATRQQLYNFVESELLALTTELAPARTNEYGRVDQAAANGYLARLYLNAGVYTGTPQYVKAAEAAKRVIDAGYTLSATAAAPVASAYGRLFLADNQVSTAKNEIIWPVIFDVNNVQSFGGTTFLINGSTSGSNSNWQRYVGQTTGWGGLRTTRALFDKFSMLGADTTVDRRGRFWTIGQTLEINDLTQFAQGLGVTKFRNITSAGVAQNASLNFSSVDFPMLRLADMMLIYAEAATRGSATRSVALGYVNQIRRRAFGLPLGTASAAADITDAQMTPGFILDERARELHWEGTRRTDLIRYDQFVESTYLWPWKGGLSSGRSVDAKYKLFPIPSSDLTANPSLRQNPGY